MERKINICYELSEDGKKDAFLKGLEPSTIQWIECDYTDNLYDLIYFNYEKEATIDTRKIIYKYVITRAFIPDYSIREVTGKIFETVQKKEDILNWISEQLKSKDEKYANAIKEKETLINKKIKEEGIFATIIMFIIIIAVIVMTIVQHK